jgi:tetratricopeptide (TPR) repeat protein
MLGRLHSSREDWPKAKIAWQRAVDLNDDDPHAQNGLAFTELKLGNFESAADHALRAIGLLFFFPMAHYVLGMAFKGMGEIDRAIRSLNLTVTQSPGFLEAHQELSELYQQTNNIPLWMNHQRMARGMPPLE